MSDNTENPESYRILGEGTFGVIIGNPGLPSICNSSDSINYLPDNSSFVTKLLKNEESFERIRIARDLLLSSFPTTEKLQELSKYLIIPGPIEEIDWEKVPYDDIRYFRQRKISKRLYKYQYRMEQGIEDLDDLLMNVLDMDSLKKYLHRFTNILDGVNLLHKTGLVHIDLKLTNMLICLDGTYKITDIDDVGDISDFAADNWYYEKLFNNPYYPVYPMATIFMWPLYFNHNPEYWSNDYLISKIERKSNRSYQRYFSKIAERVLKFVDDSELRHILFQPFKDRENLDNYLTLIKTKINEINDLRVAHRELLLYIDRYTMGINFLIILFQYFCFPVFKPGADKEKRDLQLATDTGIIKGLVLLVKLCCNPTNFAVMTTDTLCNHYAKFLSEYCNIQ